MARLYQGRGLIMVNLRELLRLGLVCAMSQRVIAKSLGISCSTAWKYLAAARGTGLTYQEVETLTDEGLKARLGVIHPGSKITRYPEPDWPQIHLELKKKHVTLRLLWEEYKQANPAGYQVSQFCYRYQRWLKRQRVTYRHTYKSGEKMFVDYAGHTVPIYDAQTGKISQAQIFIAVLGASNYTFAQAYPNQTISSWISGHISAYEYFGGVPEQTVCDNLKAGVIRACRYEPLINRSYLDMAAHYNTAIVPTRVRKPRDKAKVECGVLVVERWILAALRNRKFFSIAELNEAIKELLVRLNNRPFKQLPGSRSSVFADLEQKALKSLPQERYVLRCAQYATVNLDYHVDIDGHYYSVPYQLPQGAKVDVYITGDIVEILYDHCRIASHKLDNRKGRHTTIKDHMPSNHAVYSSWNPEYFIDQARVIGDNAVNLFKAMFERREVLEQSYRACRGILRLADMYTAGRVDAACGRSLKFRGYSYRSVSDILKNGLDRHDPRPPVSLALSHENIRGKVYFINPPQDQGLKPGFGSQEVL